MVCQNCGTEIPVGEGFCPKCGSMVSLGPGNAGTQTGVSYARSDSAIKTNTGKKRQQPERGPLLILIAILLFAVIGFVTYRFYLKPKKEKKNAYVAVEACLDALERGDINEALAYTDYNRETELADYLSSSERIAGSNIVSDTLISFMKTEECWNSVLDYGLSIAVENYEITDLRIDDDTAVAELKIESKDFMGAAYLSGDNVVEIIKESYDLDDLLAIFSSSALAAATRSPLEIGNALKSVLGPLYDQWPEQVKADFEKADPRVISIELELKKSDEKWVIESDKYLDSIENYVSDVYNALLFQ